VAEHEGDQAAVPEDVDQITHRSKGSDLGQPAAHPYTQKRGQTKGLAALVL
jgi:hypothetical protein